MPPTLSINSGGNSSPTNVADRALSVVEEVTMKADDENNNNTATTTSDDENNNNHNNNHHHNHEDKEEEEDLSASQMKRRARSHWNFVKSLHMNTQQHVQDHGLYKMGNKSSLTTAEATFLNMIHKRRLDGDHDSIVRGSVGGGGDIGGGGGGDERSSSFSPRGGGGGSGFRHAQGHHDIQEEEDNEDEEDEDDVGNLDTSNYSNPPPGSQNNNDPLAVSGRSHFSHLVQAAVAKERLRASISNRLKKANNNNSNNANQRTTSTTNNNTSTDLNPAETNFLQRLVENKNVSLEALQNAVHVLDNDPLYNPRLRSGRGEEDGEELISSFRVPDATAMMSMSEDRGKEEDEEENYLNMLSTLEEDFSKEEEEGGGGGFDDETRKKMNNAPNNDDDVGTVGVAGETQQPPPQPPLPLSEESRRRRSVAMKRRSTMTKRRSCTVETTAWNLALAANAVALDDDDDDDDGSYSLDASSRSVPAMSAAAAGNKNLLGNTNNLSSSCHTTTSRRRQNNNRRASSHAEKRMWELVHGESLTKVDSDMEHDLNKGVVECKEMGLPIKAVKKGETMDPLLMAVPTVEKTPLLLSGSKKTLEEEEEEVVSAATRNNSTTNTANTGSGGNGGDKKKVGLAQLLAAHQARVTQQQQEEGGGGGSFVNNGNDTQDVLSPLMVCCGGIESMSILNDIVNNTFDETDADAAGATGGGGMETNVEEDSLASKKRFLNIKNNNNINQETKVEAADENSIENSQHVHLSTWMGAPEDYPILGLTKTRRQKRVDSYVNDNNHDDAADDDAQSMEGEEQEGNNNNLSGDDDDPLEPHVLSPLLMKCLRDHLPYALREENFWLKYSLVRDGASLDVIFSTMRHSQHTILAIETSSGEVFGSFTSSPWRSNGNKYYGSCEAFVWMLRKKREESCSSLDEYILRESSLDVFPWNNGASSACGGGGNRNVQLSNNKKLFVGGGDPEEDVEEKKTEEENDGGGGESEKKKVQWGMALALDKDLLRGTSSRCATFASNPLIDKSRHEGSEVFEIMNMEIWALTPCMNEEMAEELELGRTFVMGFHKQS